MKRILFKVDIPKKRIKAGDIHNLNVTTREFLKKLKPSEYFSGDLQAVKKQHEKFISKKTTPKGGK